MEDLYTLPRSLELRLAGTEQIGGGGGEGEGTGVVILITGNALDFSSRY